MSGRGQDSGLGKWIGGIGKGKAAEVRQGRARLLGLLLLFDALLIIALMLSYQETELVERVIELEKTRQVYETVIVQQTITQTQVITEVVPYGSVE